MRCSHFLLLWPILRGICLPTPQSGDFLSEEGEDPTDLDTYYQDMRPEEDPGITAAKEFGTNVVLPGAVAGALYYRFRNPDIPRFQSKWHRPGTWGIGEKIKKTNQAIKQTPKKVAGKVKELPGRIKEAPGRLKEMPGQLKAEVKELPGQVREMRGKAGQMKNNIVEWPERQINKWAEQQIQRHARKKAQKALKEANTQKGPAESAKAKELRPQTAREKLSQKSDKDLVDEMNDEEFDQWVKCVQTKYKNHMVQIAILDIWGDEHTGRAVRLPAKDKDPKIVQTRTEADCVRTHREHLLKALDQEEDAKDARAKVGGASQPQSEKQKVAVGVNAFQGVQDMAKNVQSTVNGLADGFKSNLMRIADVAAKAQPNSPVSPAPMPQGVPAGVPKLAPRPI